MIDVAEARKLSEDSDDDDDGKGKGKGDGSPPSFPPPVWPAPPSWRGGRRRLLFRLQGRRIHDL